MMRKFPGKQLMKNACTQPDVLLLAEWANTRSRLLCGKWFSLLQTRGGAVHCSGSREEGVSFICARNEQAHCPLWPSASLPVKGLDLVFLSPLCKSKHIYLFLNANPDCWSTILWISVLLVLKWVGCSVEKDSESASGAAAGTSAMVISNVLQGYRKVDVARAQPALSYKMPKFYQIHPRNTVEGV